MRLSTKSSILKSTAIEITAPRLLNNPYLEKDYPGNNLKGVPVELPLFSMPGDSLALQPEIVCQAQNEAHSIIAEAQKKAEEIIRTAREQSADLRKTLEAEVRQEIIPLAQAEGLEKGLKEAEGEAASLRQQASNYLELAKQVLNNELAKADKELVSLSLLISERIIQASLKLDPQKLLKIMRNLTLLPKEKEGLKIHISLEDYEWYKELPPEDKLPYPAIIDESLKAGDSFLECAEGIFDAGIKSQLELMEQYILEELEDGRLEGLSKEG